MQGQVYIVGAGPGDPELITVRGQTLLAAAEVIFYTGSLVPETLLAVCSPQAELIDTRSHTLETWLPHLHTQVVAGKQVVRLQDGDPCLYGALHELIVFLLDHEIRFEIVPGVSAFQAAAARLRTELTVPGLVQTIILTRSQGRTEVPEPEDLAHLAAHHASICLYLSAHHCKIAEAKLLQHYSADTPMALCYHLGWPDEQVYLGRLDEMADLTQASQLSRTVLYVISPALRGSAAARSRLYSSDHSHIFRPKA
jgi:precorrin-4/cobalt-precorrin-4 C11-methyltransferase